MAALAAAPAWAGNGGASYTPTPTVTKVACVKLCASRGRARQGGTVRIVGSGLSGVSKVTFLGVAGKSDDVSVTVRPKSDRSLTLKVPLNAMSGRLALLTTGTVTTTARTKTLGILPPPPPPPTTGRLTPVPGPSDPGGPSLETATSSNVAFAGSSRGITFSYRITAPAPVSVEVDLLRTDDASTVQTWQVPSVQPGTVNNITWEGLTNGALQPDGRYAWRLIATGASGAKARSAQASDPTRDVFDLHGHVFPLRGKHTFGDGFGVQRTGHTHQGQDILSRCGLPILAAEAGKVLYNKRQSAAGNYLVIDRKSTRLNSSHQI